MTEASNCKADSCKNGGKCISLTKGFKCECKTGYTGKQCENSKLLFCF